MKTNKELFQFIDDLRQRLTEKELSTAGVMGHYLELYKWANTPVVNKNISKKPELQEFNTILWNTPFAVYSIRCCLNNKIYIGSAKNGFNTRYPQGWWINHHNKDLTKDILRHGYENFKVSIWICDDETDMLNTEKDMIIKHMERAYNKRKEPSNVSDNVITK